MRKIIKKMNKIKKCICKKLIFILLFLIFISIGEVKADVCSNEEITILKEIAKQVKISYEYNYEKYDNSGNKIYDNFDIIIENLNKDIYIKFQNKQIYYSYNESNDGTIVIGNSIPGHYVFEIRASKCATKLNTISLEVPKYNRYADDERCNNVDSNVIKYCDEWYQEIFSEKIFSEAIEQYNISNESNEENSLNLKYILCFACFLIFIIISIVLVIKKRRGVLE